MTLLESKFKTVIEHCGRIVIMSHFDQIKSFRDNVRTNRLNCNGLYVSTLPTPRPDGVHLSPKTPYGV
jgi:hypothetical protein